MEKLCRKCAPKASPRPLFNFVNAKQPLHARNCYKNKILKDNSQKPLKS